MRRLNRVLLFASPLVSIQLCAAVPLNQPAAPASGDLHNALPSQDEWYNPPSGWESTAPGTPLRVRPHAYKVVPTFNYSDVVQILFRSTDSHEKPIVAATTLFIPWSHAPCMNNTKYSNDTSHCSSKLISYQHPYDTACFDASPSWALQNGDRWGELTLGLNRGWFMAVPDYEGPRASFGANIVAGHVILDSVRALLKTVGQFGFRTNESRVGLWGVRANFNCSTFPCLLPVPVGHGIRPFPLVLTRLSLCSTAAAGRQPTSRWNSPPLTPPNSSSPVLLWVA